MERSKLKEAKQLNEEIERKTEEAKQVAIGCEDYLCKIFAEIDKKAETLSNLLLEQ